MLFYVQHLLGTGHLVRTALIARHAADRGHDVTLVSGGFPVPHLDTGAARVVQLPPLRATDASFGRLVGAGDRPVDQAWWDARRGALLAAFAAAKPDALVIEQFPFGRRKLGIELVPLLRLAGAVKPRPVVVCSVRDVLTARDDPVRLDEMAAMARRMFDAVLVHGDPTVLPFVASFPRAVAIADLVRYTGYVVARPSPAGTGSGEILVSAGGGAVAGPLLHAAIGAAKLGRHRWRILAGGGVAAGAFAELVAAAPPNAIVERNRSDFRDLLANCAASVSQGGYNTVLEALIAGARAVIVPFAADGQSEQTQRARRLADLGFLDMVPESSLTPERLAVALDQALARPVGRVPTLDFAGAENTVGLLEAMIAQRHDDVARA